LSKAFLLNKVVLFLYQVTNKGIYHTSNFKIMTNSVLPINKAKQLIKDYKGIQGADMFLADLLTILVFDTQSIYSVKDLIDYYILVQKELRKIQKWEEVLADEEPTEPAQEIEYTEEQIQILEHYYDEQKRQQQLD
jgi:subtilase family serine protease